MKMSRLTMAVLGLSLGLALVACSDDKKKSATDAGGGQDSGSTDSGTKDSGASKDSGPVDAGGLMCDDTVKPATKCGSTDCPALPAMAAMFCGVTCCTADTNECGLRSAVQGQTTECAAPGKPDPRCPSPTLLGTKTQGCCAAANECGILFDPSYPCVPASAINMRQPGTVPEQKCDAPPPADAGADDAN